MSRGSPTSSILSAVHTSEKKPRSSRNLGGRISTSPSSSRTRTSSILMLLSAPSEIGGIFGAAERVGAGADLIGVEIAQLEADLLEAHDLEALAMLDGAHERRGLVQAFMGA